ncbi:MAG: SAM-dependent methyltransferase [Gammaproteobacteria bacterium]|nr:SAM-dependent methyltransferase [Gammaproteobacteria bacterium]NIO61301.1 SAM-dependent methyltransferase [Gammaproteobacteria bacterium]NIT12793.1 SAM-dependent methyltransferase [Candidatus Dadabacteria bacterium]NIT40893.1 SAM-dependent methyltransferase [Gammaproteobacteria bacterium]
MKQQAVSGSFRDPSGYVYARDGKVYRRIHNCYRDDYELFIKSGLYETLVRDGLLVSHEEISPQDGTDNVFLDLLPEQIPFISYPYEWSLSQLLDAGLLTLRIQQRALEHGMSLKDASSYNVQFYNGKPIFIDTLSFEKYQEGRPWVAYQQYCQHFLAPLALMKYCDVRLVKLLCTNLDGVPVELASKILPRITLFNPGCLMHIHLQALAKIRYSDSAREGEVKFRPVSKLALQRIITSLERTTEKMQRQPQKTEWSDYYESKNNYDQESLGAKENFIKSCLDSLSPNLVWDFGANTGRFSRLASSRCCLTIACDIDHSCVDINYQAARQNGETHLLPLYLDITNPSPAIGWNNHERFPLTQRSKPDLVIALALIHHLAISNNIPLDKIAAFLAECSPNLVIEFVPKTDSMVQRLLQTREDIFPDYSREQFEAVFSGYYRILHSEQLAGSDRYLYQMERTVAV